MTNNQNYFNLFNLPIKLPVDQKKLAEKYQQLQRAYHPDNFALCPEKKQLTMLKKSADINQAYQSLQDPIGSAEYLLSLNGVLLDAEQTISHDHDFLIEQFELHEQLETIKNLTNNSEKQPALSEFSSQRKKGWHDTYQQLLSVIDEYNWSLAVFYINKLRFFKKIQQAIEEIEDQLFDF